MKYNVRTSFFLIILLVLFFAFSVNAIVDSRTISVKKVPQKIVSPNISSSLRFEPTVFPTIIEQSSSCEHNGWIAFSSVEPLIGEINSGETKTRIDSKKIENENYFDLLEQKINSYVYSLRGTNKKLRITAETSVPQKSVVLGKAKLITNMFVLDVSDYEANQLKKKFPELSFSENCALIEPESGETITQLLRESQAKAPLNVSVGVDKFRRLTASDSNSQFQGMNLAEGIPFGLTGQGIKIGLLGMGVDFIHKDFGCNLLMTFDVDDNGDNPYVPGKVRVSDTLRTDLNVVYDYCSNTSTLVEYYASSNVGNNIASKTYTCASGCSMVAYDYTTAGKCNEAGIGPTTLFNPYEAVFNSCTNKFIGGRTPTNPSPSYRCDPNNVARQKYCTPYDIYSSGYTTSSASIIAGKLDYDGDNVFDEGDFFGVAPDAKLYPTIDYYISEWVLSTEEMMDPNHNGDISDKMDLIYSNTWLIPSSSTNLDYIYDMLDNVVDSGTLYVSPTSSNGPSSSSVKFPGAHDKVIAIGSIDAQDVSNWSSAYASGKGPIRYYPDGSYYVAKPDLVADGNVWNATRLSDDQHSENFYAAFGGALGAGLVALLKERNPTITNPVVWNLLTKNTDYVGNNFFTLGYGLMNAQKVLEDNSDWNKFDYVSEIKGPNYALWDGSTNNPCSYFSGPCPETLGNTFDINGKIFDEGFVSYKIEMAKVRNFYTTYNTNADWFDYDSRFVEFNTVFESNVLPVGDTIASGIPIPKANGYFILKLTVDFNDKAPTVKYNAIENWKGAPVIELINPATETSFPSSNIIDLNIFVKEEPRVLDYGSLTIRYNINGGPDTTMNCTTRYYVSNCVASNLGLINGINTITFWARNGFNHRVDKNIAITVGDFNWYERNGLLWPSDDENGLYTWDDAILKCEDKNLHGVVGWRLPTIAELGDGTNYCGDSHTCSSSITSGICVGYQPDALVPGFELDKWYWTSTPMEYNNAYKCVVGFGTGVEVVPNPKPRVGWLYWANDEHTALWLGKVKCVKGL